MHPLIQAATQAGVSRRQFLRQVFYTAGGAATASLLASCGISQPPDLGIDPDLPVPPLPPVRSPFADIGPLLPPDANGIQLPAGFTSRVLAVINQPPMEGNPFRWHSDPDGAGVFRTEDGGWILLSNCEARDATTAFGQLPAPLAELASRDSLEPLGTVTGPISGLLPVSVPLVLL